MPKNTIYDYTNWFLENNLDNPRNTYKGNMKLQKLLFFAQLISLAKNNKLLFEDEFCAFKNGMVMEDIRLKYKNELDNLLNYKRNKLSKEELEILNLTKNIYGKENADTLSDMHHQFSYWQKYLDLAKDKNNYQNKAKSKIPNDELKNELDNIKDVLDAYYLTQHEKYNIDDDFDY